MLEFCNISRLQRLHETTMNTLLLKLIITATAAVAVGGTTYVVLTILEVIHKE
jgi:hypothetical protein